MSLSVCLHSPPKFLRLFLAGHPFVRMSQSGIVFTLMLIHGSVASADATSPILKIEVVNAAHAVLTSQSAPQSVSLSYGAAYQAGDEIAISAPTGARYLAVQIDDKVPEAMIFVPGGNITYAIPSGKNLTQGYAPGAFAGSSHLIKARLVPEAELATYRNVALDPLDLRGQTQFFPHATASAVTRDEPQFFDRNAIDGNSNNKRHGPWPYESWAGGQREDLTYLLDFGRPVEIDKARLFIRCDFPHDNYWKSLTIRFSDGSSQDVSILKTTDPQEYAFPKKTVTWIKLINFKQAAHPLGWAALTEIEIWGKDAPPPHN